MQVSGKMPDSLELIEVSAKHFEDVMDKVGEQLPSLEEHLNSVHFPTDELGHGADLVHKQVSGLSEPVQVLVRLKPPIVLGNGSETTSFLWILLSSKKTHPHLDSALEFAKLLHHDSFKDKVHKAQSGAEVAELYRKYLDDEVHFNAERPPELTPTGKLFGGIMADLKRCLPDYVSDFTDGLTSKSLGSVLFLFFACLAPAIAFGGLLSELTNGELGAMEMLVSTAVAGIAYALFSAQPLTILGSTGPVIIFMGLLYNACQSMDVPYLPTLACVGLWTTVILIVLSVTGASCWIHYFTRFTDETFAALISIIFIVAAVKDVAKVFTDPSVSHATALLSLILALGTFLIARQLSQFRRSPYLRRWVREFLADFGPAIAIALMAGVAFLLHEVDLKTLAVPETFGPTNPEREWFVNPFDAPLWVQGASFVPAVLVSILLYLDQNITVRLVNNPDHNLKKGAGYHLDLLVVGILVGICSLFGLPWMVAATVRSLNHVRSLAEVETDDQGRSKVIGVCETRVTGVLVHVMVAASLLILPYLKLVPMSVLFGLFLYMGVGSMAGNQMFERLQLWVMEPSRYPTHYYLRAVPASTVHKFTAIQLACLGVLWTVKSSKLGILFPLFIALLVPVRMLLDKYFSNEHLALLDAEEMPEEEEERAGGP